MPFAKSVMLGVVGDSAAGKTTISQGLAQILGEEKVTVICTDDYHRYNRKTRKEIGISALDPECNYIDIMEQHLDLLRRGHPILKPIYNHSTGDFDPPEYIEPREYIIVEGLLGFYSKVMRRPFDIKVYLQPEETLRTEWKVKRDTAKRGYTTEEVLDSLKKREPDSANFIRPQQRHADVVVSFYKGEGWDQDPGSSLDVKLILRPSLAHPDLSGVLASGKKDELITTEVNREDGRLIEVLDISRRLESNRAKQIEDVIWNNMPDVQPISPNKIGVYLDGNEECQSHTLALTQLLITYHMLLARQELDAEIEERIRKHLP